MFKTIQIQVAGEFLDLQEGTEINFERENPLLQFTDQVKGGYTFPFEIKNSDQNARVLNFPGLINTRITDTGWDAIIYDSGIPVFRGKLKIEKSNIDLFTHKHGNISCYIITDVADFYQDIKDMKMRDVDCGGDRSFDWDGTTTATTGFWSHIHAVANAGPGSGYDYAFFPFINKGWPKGDETPDIMNLTYWDDGQPVTKIMFPEHITGLTTDYANRIVPFPYLKYVIQRVFNHIGWNVAGDILSDTDFEKICMINFRAINWTDESIAGTVVTLTPRDPVVFDLKNNLPDTTISNFLIQLKNRMGWWYDIDRVSKTITIRNVSDVVLTNTEDYTGRTSQYVPKTVLPNQRIFSLKNGVDPFDITKVNYQGTISYYGLLPTPIEALSGQVYFGKAENTYWICQQDSTDAWAWLKFYDNNFDYVPANATDEITTTVQIPTMEDIQMGGTIFKCFCPRYDNGGFWDGRDDNTDEWPIILCFYHGPVFNIDNSGKYPYGAPHVYDVHFNDLGNWALPYKFTKGFTEVGLYDQFWKYFLDTISTREEFELTVYVSFLESMGLNDSSILVLNGVRMMIKTKRQVYPFNGMITLVCIRI